MPTKRVNAEKEVKDSDTPPSPRVPSSVSSSSSSADDNTTTTPESSQDQGAASTGARPSATTPAITPGSDPTVAQELARNIENLEWLEDAQGQEHFEQVTHHSSSQCIGHSYRYAPRSISSFPPLLVPEILFISIYIYIYVYIFNIMIVYVASIRLQLRQCGAVSESCVIPGATCDCR